MGANYGPLWKPAIGNNAIYVKEDDLLTCGYSYT